MGLGCEWGSSTKPFMVHIGELSIVLGRTSVNFMKGIEVLPKKGLAATAKVFNWCASGWARPFVLSGQRQCRRRGGAEDGRVQGDVVQHA